MQQLPVPELAQTLDRYLQAVSPLLAADELDATREAVARFADGAGPAAQAELRRFAEVENAAGRSWLSAAWLDSYLRVRDPLPLSTSATLQIRLPAGEPARAQSELDGPSEPGLEWAAEVVHRLARVHLGYLRGQLPPETTPRGEPVCEQQRAVLAGGLRHPLPGLDEIRPGRSGADSREIGVLIDDRYVAVPISDATGRVLPEATLRQLLAQAVDQAQRAPAGFTTLSGLGSEVAAPLLAELLDDAANAALYARLTDAVFVVALGRVTDPHATDDGITDGGGTDEADAEVSWLQRLAFGGANAWAYKPLTYQLGLDRGLVVAHMEHTSPDGGTLKNVVDLAQQLPDEPDQPDEATADRPGSGDAADPPPVAVLSWRESPQLRARLDREAQVVAARARGLRLQVVTVDAPETGHLPYPVSDDAVQQWIFLYAQLATYGRLRSTYESVDMRHMQAGRTECLRPNNAAAAALVRALLDGAATGEQVQAALVAHKDWVRACKTGHGIDRHLLGLRLAAQRLELTPELFTDPAYTALTTDFLSTTSLGGQRQVVRTAFAPTSRGGIGIYYSLVPGGYQFLLSRDEHTEHFAEFVANLHAGAHAVRTLLTTL